ncbi:MAG: hypothetical protein RL077_4612 [Verrucomicrobiota bacterium]
MLPPALTLQTSRSTSMANRLLAGRFRGSSAPQPMKSPRHFLKTLQPRRVNRGTLEKKPD